jgi:hypothetical protein
VAGELLGDGRGALDGGAGAGDRDEGARHADRVEAEMGVEAAVLGGDDGLREVVGQIGQTDRLAAGVAAIGDQLAVGGDDADVRRPVGNRPRGDARKLGAEIGDDAAEGDEAPDAGDRAPVIDSTTSRHGMLVDVNS